MEQLNNPDIGPILQDVEMGQQPEWKDIAEAQLGIRQRAISNSPNSSSSEQSKGCAD
jgi:hypothetical protein